MVFPLKPPFSSGFPMVFPLKPPFSYGFPRWINPHGYPQRHPALEAAEASTRTVVKRDSKRPLLKGVCGSKGGHISIIISSHIYIYIIQYIYIYVYILYNVYIYTYDILYYIYMYITIYMLYVHIYIIIYICT